jgi:hypothetical protein
MLLGSNFAEIPFSAAIVEAQNLQENGISEGPENILNSDNDGMNTVVIRKVLKYGPITHAEPSDKCSVCP